MIHETRYVQIGTMIMSTNVRIPSTINIIFIHHRNQDPFTQAIISNFVCLNNFNIVMTIFQTNLNPM